MEKREKQTLSNDQLSSIVHKVTSQPEIPDEVNGFFQDLVNQYTPKYRQQKLEISITNASEKYELILKRSLNSQNSWKEHRTMEEAINDQLDWWLRQLCWNGKLTCELVAWSNTDEVGMEYVTFELLNSKQSYVWKNYIYFFPEAIRELTSARKYARIPLSKCILMEWPKLFGGYKGYLNTLKRLKKVGGAGSSFEFSADFNPRARMRAMQQRETQIAKNTVRWGANQKVEDVSEYYRVLLWFRHCHLGRLLVNEVIGGMHQLIPVLNKQLSEQAELKITNTYPSLNLLLENEMRWSEGKLTFDEVNQFLSKF